MTGKRFPAPLQGAIRFGRLSGGFAGTAPPPANLHGSSGAWWTLTFIALPRVQQLDCQKRSAPQSSPAPKEPWKLAGGKAVPAQPPEPAPKSKIRPGRALEEGRVSESSDLSNSLLSVLVTASLLPVALLLGCGGPLEPAPITPDQDICSHCRMTIVQPELAAQAVRPGLVDFFDDIGCLAAWLRQHPAGGEMALFVADFESGEWLKAQDAFYAQSPSMPTPMHSGLTAFRTAERAQATAGRLQGRLLSWDEVLQEAEP